MRVWVLLLIMHFDSDAALCVGVFCQGGTRTDDGGSLCPWPFLALDSFDFAAAGYAVVIL